MCLILHPSQTEAEVESALSQLRQEGARVEAEGARVREEGERVMRERQALERDRDRMEAFGAEIQQRAQEIEEMCQVHWAKECFALANTIHNCVLFFFLSLSLFSRQCVCVSRESRLSVRPSGCSCSHWRGPGYWRLRWLYSGRGKNSLLM